MANSYQPEPFEARESQNLNFGDYVKKVALYTWLPVAAGAAGIAAGVFGKNKLPVFNGKPPAIQNIVNKVTDKYSGANISVEYERGLWPVFWNFTKGAFPVGVVTSFWKWQKDEQHQLDLIDVHEELKDIEPYLVSSESLTKENAALNAQLKWVQSVGPVGQIEHEGKISSAKQRQEDKQTGLA